MIDARGRPQPVEVALDRATSANHVLDWRLRYEPSAREIGLVPKGVEPWQTHNRMKKPPLKNSPTSLAPAKEAAAASPPWTTRNSAKSPARAARPSAAT